MINFSKKAAQRFNIQWAKLDEHSGDNWKIDIIMVSRYPVLLIIHEYTLYTLVRRKSNFKTVGDIHKEIKRCCPWYKNYEDAAIGKNSDKKLTGSINEMKRMTAGNYSLNFTEEIQQRINTCIFSYLSEEKYGYGRPIEALEKYKNDQWPRENKTG